jgi:hypothetical protein
VNHVNAETVLPPKLLREIQRHCSGYIYIPSPRGFWRDRRDEGLLLHSRGLGTAEIAGRVHLCVRRVQQIIKGAAVERAE